MKRFCRKVEFIAELRGGLESLVILVFKSLAYKSVAL